MKTVLGIFLLFFCLLSGFAQSNSRSFQAGIQVPYMPAIYFDDGESQPWGIAVSYFWPSQTSRHFYLSSQFYRWTEEARWRGPEERYMAQAYYVGAGIRKEWKRVRWMHHEVEMGFRYNRMLGLTRESGESNEMASWEPFPYFRWGLGLSLGQHIRLAAGAEILVSDGPPGMIGYSRLAWQW